MIYARWKPHILTDQNRVRVQAAKQMPKKVSRIRSDTFSNNVAEIWVYYFEPVRKLGNKNGKLNTVNVMLLPKKKHN